GVRVVADHVTGRGQLGGGVREAFHAPAHLEEGRPYPLAGQVPRDLRRVRLVRPVVEGERHHPVAALAAVRVRPEHLRPRRQEQPVDRRARHTHRGRPADPGEGHRWWVRVTADVTWSTTASDLSTRYRRGCANDSVRSSRASMAYATVRSRLGNGPRLSR